MADNKSETGPIDIALGAAMQAKQACEIGSDSALRGAIAACLYGLLVLEIRKAEVHEADIKAFINRESDNS